MKKFYFEPAIEIKRFQADDVITASGGDEDKNAPIKGIINSDLNVEVKSLSWASFTF